MDFLWELSQKTISKRFNSSLPYILQSSFPIQTYLVPTFTFQLFGPTLTFQISGAYFHIWLSCPILTLKISSPHIHFSTMYSHFPFLKIWSPLSLFNYPANFNPQDVWSPLSLFNYLVAHCTFKIYGLHFHFSTIGMPVSLFNSIGPVQLNQWNLSTNIRNMTKIDSRGVSFKRCDKHEFRRCQILPMINFQVSEDLVPVNIACVADDPQVR